MYGKLAKSLCSFVETSPRTVMQANLFRIVLCYFAVSLMGSVLATTIGLFIAVNLAPPNFKFNCKSDIGISLKQEYLGRFKAFLEQFPEN